MSNWLEPKTGIVAIRIDDRLLHGIITTQWIPHIPCDRVMVIDDVVATDPLKKEVMRLSKPGSKALSVINQETAMRNFKANKYQGQRLFILSRNFQVLSSLRELGYTLPEINIGMYYSKQPDRILTRRIVLSHEDTEIIRSLLRDNCCFKAQYVPSDEAVKLNGLLETL